MKSSKKSKYQTDVQVSKCIENRIHNRNILEKNSHLINVLLLFFICGGLITFGFAIAFVYNRISYIPLFIGVAVVIAELVICNHFCKEKWTCLSRSAKACLAFVSVLCMGTAVGLSVGLQLPGWQASLAIVYTAVFLLLLVTSVVRLQYKQEVKKAKKLDVDMKQFDESGAINGLDSEWGTILKKSRNSLSLPTGSQNIGNKTTFDNHGDGLDNQNVNKKEKAPQNQTDKKIEENHQNAKEDNKINNNDSDNTTNNSMTPNK